MRNALVTGGTSGIGLETVIQLSQLGYRVITCSRNEDNWNKVLATNSDLSAVDYLCVDLKDVKRVDSMFAYIRENYGSLDVAINNASPQLASKGNYEEVGIDSLYGTLIGDFWTHALCLKYELGLMTEDSAIVNVSSVNGSRPTPSAAMYSAAKHGLEGLTRSIALEAIKKKIRVNAIAPGVTWTPRWQEGNETAINILKETVSRKVPAGRFAEVSEIANAITWLCSENARYIVGHTLVVDGGLSLA
ncbi:SDR family NAD(P)-dependent oxidoreductase [Veronia pacifica]|uniref:Dehydrogenase n=1 Tax=Veronia pacifica TaxID=1080227 RepID=A0A1C3ECX3_9GAMM|nr:SDR family oxidoreductase [Veronia pacifica]ODA31107.1 dehydrogenase [Veronia pacifica]